MKNYYSVIVSVVIIGIVLFVLGLMEIKQHMNETFVEIVQNVEEQKKEKEFNSQFIVLFDEDGEIVRRWNKDFYMVVERPEWKKELEKREKEYYRALRGR